MKKRFLRGMVCLLLACWLLPAVCAAGEEAAPAAATPVAESTETALPEPAATPLPTLSSGAKGEDVRRLQQRLTDLGYKPGKPDGIFGSGTRSAVSAFQRRNGLSADGVAGPLTLERLYAEDALGIPEVIEPLDVLSGNLPLLVNPAHPVDEYFLPADLVVLNDVCDPKLVKIKYKNTRAVREAADALIAMLRAAEADGVKKWQISAAYRSYDQQVSMLNSKIRSYLNKNESWSRSRARSAALRTVAEPGASEHHLGLALDINVPGTSAFISTKQCTWLHQHCWEYGFIVRYPEGKEDITGFSPEPWHIRYVGIPHALAIRDSGLCLEEYLDALASGALSNPALSSGEEEITEDILLPDE